MAQFAVHRPFDEAHLDHDLQPRPVCAQTRQPDRFGKRRLRYFEFIELSAKIEQHLRVEAGADLAGEYKVAILVVADEKRAQSNALPLRICKATDKKILR